MDESEMRVDQRVRRSMRSVVREAFVTGLAVIVPLLITAIVLAVAVQYIYTYLDLFSTFVLAASEQVVIPYFGTFQREALIEVLTPVILLWLILVVGLFTNATHWGERAVDYFDYFISQIPAVGGVYESFRQMSDVVLESDTQNFRDVKLVEFPHEGAYTLGFVTTETPVALSEPAGHTEMLTLFLPLAPNPVMGGHLVHMPANKVMDVDMTVEEGIRAIVTSGVAVAGGGAGGNAGLDEDKLRELASIEHADQQFTPGVDSPTVRRSESVNTERSSEYDEAVEPERATTPDDIARRERDEPVGGVAEDTPAERVHGVQTGNSQVTPAEEAGRYQRESEGTDRRPAAAADRDAERRDSTERTPEEMADRDAADREETEERPAEAADRDAEQRGETEERPADTDRGER
jgi:uncharacterized membrane protein